MIRLGVAFVALVLGGCAGCERVGYVVRSGVSEARVLWHREPIAPMLARPDLDPQLRASLELTLAVRRFAAGTLGLRVGQSFTSFAPLDGRTTVWVVSAARRDRLEAVTWWWPIVGRVPYQGFFARASADRFAAGLAARDLDVDVRSASAFSTLGWFADPLLSTTAKAPPVELADTIVHELFHATLYLPGQTAFNESAATFVGHRGAIAWFCGPGADPRACGEARGLWRALRAHARILGRYAARLRALYATDAPPARLARRRAALAAAAERALVRRRLDARGALLPPNNARLLGMLAYETELDAFDRLAPTDAALPGAIATLVERVRGASDPFAVVHASVPPPRMATPGARLSAGSGGSDGETHP